METRIVDGAFVECLAPLTKIDDALELIPAVYASDTGRLLIEAAHLPDDFFDLKTRFAGEFIQKLRNYRIVIAFVIAPGTQRSTRFQEFVREARSGFRFFETRGDADAWLRSQADG